MIGRRGGLSGLADQVTDTLWRWRRLLAGLSVLGALLLAPLADIRTLDNDVSAWFQRDDPVYTDYERLKKEFPGSRTLIIALAGDDAFAPAMLEALRGITADVERVQAVRRVQSLATANVVRLQEAPASGGLQPAGGSPIDGEDTADELLVEPLLPPSGPIDAAAVRREALADRLVAGDLVSTSGRVLSVIVSFDEARIDAVRPQVLDEIRARVAAQLPPGVTAHYNGSLEISETYNRVTLRNQVVFTPPILLITIVAIYVMFRSWRLTLLTLFAVLVSTLWTLGLYMWAGFGFNVLTSMLPALVLVLAIADDVHIIQHYTQCRREGMAHEQAWRHTVRHLITPLLAASGTTALGLLSLATSQVDAVRTFGIGAALGVMVDFAVSITLMPTLLGWVPVLPLPPQSRWLLAPMRAIGRISATHPWRVVLVTVSIVVAAGVGLPRLRVDTNHVAFFKPGHPIHDSAELMDRELSGIYSFQVLLEGPPESLRAPEALQRIDTLRMRLEQLSHVKKVVTLADYVARVHEQLAPAAVRGTQRLPSDADLVSQELFVFGMSEEGRRELESLVSTDYSRTQVMVKLASMSSDEAFEEVEEAERIATELFAGTGITPTVTGAGRLFATLDHYLVTSQLSSFATAFFSVFAVIFIVFRSIKFGLLAIVPNVIPVVIVLGAMGWLDISMNVATVMVASIALGVVDDDTIHFISRYRREARAGRSTDEAIALATEEEGRASLTTAIINTLAFSVLLLSDYRPSGWFGGLLAMTMAVAFLAEVFLLPSIIRLLPSLFDAASLRDAHAA